MRKFGNESTAPEDTGVSREKSDKGWLKNHWCALSICVIVIAAFLLRTVFAYGVSADGGFALSGGSSAQYHLHVIESILNGSYSVTDSTVNYPIGGLNVYPPLMDFIAAGVAMVASAAGLSTTEAASFALASLNPVFGALTCIPVYLVGKEMFDKKIGVVAALVFAFLALPISTSVFSSGTEYALAAFLVAFMSYFMVKMVHALDAEDGSKKSVYVNAVLAGLFLALAALTWNGFRILLVVPIIAMVIQILVDRFSGRNFTNVLMGYAIIMLVGVVVAAPYYIVAGLWDAVFSGPLLIAVVAIVFGFLFKALESKPWIFVVPGLIVVFIAFLAVLYFAAPGLFDAFVSGNSIYSSSIMASLVSDRVSMSNVASYYGWLTTWMPICLGIYEFYVYARKDRSATQLFKAVWLLVLFFAVWTTYANAAVIGVVFAVGSAAVIVKVLEAADLKSWYNTMKVAGFPGCLRKMVKPFPFASVLIVALLVIVPNVSFAVDAGMPSNDEPDYFFSGNTQFNIKTGDSYPIEDLWNTTAGIEKDGALVNWIDYTYDAVAHGGFQTVTDTVGGGSSAVAHIYTAEGSSGAIAAMMLRIVLAGDVDDYKSVLCEDVIKFIKDPALAVAAIEADPAQYGNIRSDVTDENAVYLVCVDHMVNEMGTIEIMDAYDKVCQISGEKISYILLDASLLPLQYNDGSNFSTIAYFADYTVDSYGAATEFFTYNTYSGTTQYTDAIYDTFLWKAMIGASAKDAGMTSSYGYLSELVSSDGDIMAQPGYGLSGFEVAYWSVQYNEKVNATVTDDGWVYMDAVDAIAKQKAEGGSINYLSSIILMEYTGSVSTGTISGQVVDDKGNAVNGADISVYQYNEMYSGYTLLAETKVINGAYALPAPAGDYIVKVDVGGIELGAYKSADLSSKIVIETADLEGAVILDDVVTDVDFKLKLEGSVVGDVEPVDITDGWFFVTGLIPDTYTYTLLNSDAASVATGTIKVSSGVNDGLKISPKSYNLTVKVEDVYGEPKESGEVIVTDVITGAQFIGEVEDGQTVIKVLPGKYDVSLGAGYATLGVATQNLSSGNRTVTVTAYDAEGYTKFPNVGTLTLSGGSYSTVIVDGTAYYPVGVATDEMAYTVYGVDNGKVYIGYYDGQNYNGKVADAITVTGTLKSGDKGVSGTVNFVADNKAVITVTTDSDGKYAVPLAAGEYTVLADNGSNKAYIGTVTVSSGSELDITLQDGRKVTPTFRYDAQTHDGKIKAPFVKVLLVIEVEGKSYTLETMTGKDGSGVFYIPDDIAAVAYANDIDGKLDNNAFSCSELKYDVSASTGNSTPRFDISVKDPEKESKNYLKDVSIKNDNPFDMKFQLYDGDEEDVFTLAANQSMNVAPGQYDVTVDNKGYYFDGTVYIYPGDSYIYGVDAMEVSTLTITKGEGDIVSIESEGEYIRDGNKYFLEVGYDYYLKSVNGDKVAYGYINAASASTEIIDLTAKDGKISISGYVGVVADGTLMITSGDVKVKVEVADGQYEVDLPAGMTSAEFAVDVTSTIGSDEFGFQVTEDITGLKDGDVRNLAALSTGEIPDVDEDAVYDASIVAGSVKFNNGVGTLVVEIYNEVVVPKTFMVTAGPAWYLDGVYTVTVGAEASAKITVNGIYDENSVAIGSDGLNVTVSDIAGVKPITLDITDGESAKTTSNGTEFLVAGESAKAYKDKISAYEYMYALTVINKDSFSKDVTVNVSDASGWAVTLMDEDGCTISETGSAFTVYGYQTTVIYVKLLNLTGTGADVPAITGTITDGSASKTLDLKAQTVDISADSMEATGTDVSNEMPTMPVGIWILLAVSVLLIIMVFWLASRRGVFTRRS